MASNLAIDQDLLAEAMQIGGLPTKKATVNEALRLYIKRQKQLDAVKLFGTFDFDPEYDYKEERRRSTSTRISRES